MKIRYKLEDGALPPSYQKPGDAGARDEDPADPFAEPPPSYSQDNDLP